MLVTRGEQYINFEKSENFNQNRAVWWNVNYGCFKKSTETWSLWKPNATCNYKRHKRTWARWVEKNIDVNLRWMRSEDTCRFAGNFCKIVRNQRIVFFYICHRIYTFQFWDFSWEFLQKIAKKFHGKIFQKTNNSEPQIIKIFWKFWKPKIAKNYFSI